MHATNDFWDFTQYRRDILSTVTLYFTFLRVKLAISLCFKIHMVYDIPAPVCNISLLISSEKGNISVTCFLFLMCSFQCTLRLLPPFFSGKGRVLLHVCINNFSFASRNVQWSLNLQHLLAVSKKNPTQYRLKLPTWTKEAYLNKIKNPTFAK